MLNVHKHRGYENLEPMRLQHSKYCNMLNVNVITIQHKTSLSLGRFSTYLQNEYCTKNPKFLPVAIYYGQ